MKHTEGDWQVITETDHRPGIDAGGQTIIMVGHKSNGDDSGIRGRCDEEALHNAILIASAPNLVKELEFLMDELDILRRRISKTIRAATHLRSWRNKASSHLELK